MGVSIHHQPLFIGSYHRLKRGNGFQTQQSSVAVILGLCVETGVHRRYQLMEEVTRRTVRSGEGKGDPVSISLVEPMATVVTVYIG